jgi:O-antigen/teichoic acid export membrane protein
MAIDPTEHGRRIRRDTLATVLLGPFRLLAITVGTVFLLRVVLQRAGLEVVGLWSLLNVVAAFISLMDMGFSSLLAREIHVSDSREQSAEHFRDIRAIERFYGSFLLLAILPAMLAIAWIGPAISYDRTRFFLALILMAGNAVVQLRGKLEAAVLAAYQDNAQVQVVQMLGVFIFLAVAITSACLEAPLEGAALGSLLSAQWIWWRLRRQVASHQWVATSIQLDRGESFQRVARMAKAGIHFYSLALGSVLRDSGFRMIITALLGAKVLGAYTIGFRLSVTTRDLVAGGFNVLFPSMASLHRSENRQDIVMLQATSAVFLLALGSVALGCLYGFVEPLLRLLLGSIPEGVVVATRILVIWNLITLFNVPFDHLLQATGHERISAAALWFHTLAILLVWPLRAVLRTDLEGLLVYWTIASVATQLIIFTFVQIKLNGFWPIVTMRPVWIALLLAWSYWAIVLAWVPHAQGPAGSWDQAVDLARILLPAGAACAGLSLAGARPLLSRYGRERGGRP